MSRGSPSTRFGTKSLCFPFMFGYKYEFNTRVSFHSQPFSAASYFIVLVLPLSSIVAMAKMAFIEASQIMIMAIFVAIVLLISTEIATATPQLKLG